jgi:alkanesulfonate monooxygenase SsuD/methylene tetrahydromethanopterin reductase-like flavin-dependent oxidoreductase (luciferase family)
VYVDETDERALAIGLERASRAHVGLLPLAAPGETFQDRLAKQRKRFEERGEPGAAKISSSMFEPDYMLRNELVFIGSPKTVAEKIQKAAETGFFNTMMCEFNFADLPEADLMRSIRLFGGQVIPQLRDYEPF